MPALVKNKGIKIKFLLAYYYQLFHKRSLSAVMSDDSASSNTYT